MQWNRVISDKKFAPFFWTQFWGAFNDNFFKNALVLIVAFRGIQLLGLNSASLVAVSGALIILPFFLFSPLAGQIADKYEKAYVVRAVKIWEIGIMIFAALGFLFDSYLLLLGLLFLMGTQSAFFGPIKYSIIPELVGEEDLLEGNALTELGTFASILFGTIAGGVVTTFSNADIWIACGLIFFALLGFFAAYKIPKVAVGDPDLKLRWNLFPEYITLWRLIAANKTLFIGVIAISWFWFFGAAVLSLLPVYVKDIIHGNENIATLFLSLFTLGVGVGSMLCEVLSKKINNLGLVPVGATGLTLFSLDLFLSGSPWINAAPESVTLSLFFSTPVAWRIMVDFTFMSLSGGLFIVPLYTLIQKRSDKSSRSRVIAATNIINSLFMVCASVRLIVFYHMGLSSLDIFAVVSVMNFFACAYFFKKNPEFFAGFSNWLKTRQSSSRGLQ